MPNAPGKGLLKVTGILMVIFASIEILLLLLGSGLMMLVGFIAGTAADTAGVLNEAMATAGVSIALIVIALVVGFIAAIFELVVGIIGIKNSNVLEKAQTCFNLAIVILVIQFGSLVLGIVSSGFSPLSLIGFVLPVLYLIGANMNKKALAQQAQQYPQQQYSQQQQYPPQY